MRIKLKLTFGFLLAAALFVAAPCFSEPEWVLLWEDQFNGRELDEARWRVEDAALIKNNEQQYYSPEEVYLENAMLVIRSQKIARNGRQYTSGLVETAGKFSRKYGRFEARARLPRGKGIWPAFWMLPESGDWPPEIDIFELLGHAPSTIYMTCHWGTWPDKKHKGRMFTGPDFTAGFHDFALEWEPHEIRWYIDGQMAHRVRENIPHEPFYLILNTAVGGNWPGSPSSTTVFPQYFYIDYVRVYAQEFPNAWYLIHSADNGRITASPLLDVYPSGMQVTLTADPAIGYEFVGWSGDVGGGENPTVVKMDRHKKVEAIFRGLSNPPALISGNASVTVSSLESAELAGANLTDGNLRTRWSSRFADPQWACIDLGQEYLIDAVRLEWEAAYARNYELQVSQDGKTWNTVRANNSGWGQTEEITGLNTIARYVQLYGIERATEFGYSLWEIEVFGREPEGR